MATKFKEKIKKGKEECRKLTEEVAELNKQLKKSEALDQVAYAEMQAEIDALKKDKQDKEQEMINIKKEQVSLIEHLEQSKNFSF